MRLARAAYRHAGESARVPVHEPPAPIIRQREIPTHAPSFEQGIVDALRENPDVLVISEMRTPEVMRLTLNAAETGHLVLATMHSANCAEALSRPVHVVSVGSCRRACAPSSPTAWSACAASDSSS